MVIVPFLLKTSMYTPLYMYTKIIKRVLLDIAAHFDLLICVIVDSI